jgi:riboflavin synthase
VFTGIIETTGIVEGIHPSGMNRIFHIRSEIAKELRIGESVAHNGVCLTVEPDEVSREIYRVTAVAETLRKTALGLLSIGSKINLERALRADGRLDGHFVQGHVDTVGEIDDLLQRDGSTEYWIRYPVSHAPLIVPQGSICVNGISLTVSGLHKDRFAVNIIPHTAKVTDAGTWQKGTQVNLEFDILGKYIMRFLELRELIR